jgi:hypothetical protein
MTSSDATPQILTAEICELEFLWGETRSEWNDRVAEDFEVHVIAPLQGAVRDLSNTIAEHSSTQS